MAGLLEWIISFLPPYPKILAYAVVSAAAILICGTLCGALKRYAGWKTGYTRKTLHFLIFFTAVGLHLHGGMPAVNILGLGMGIFVFLAVWAGEGNFYFEAMAREKDSPRPGCSGNGSDPGKRKCDFEACSREKYTGHEKTVLKKPSTLMNLQGIAPRGVGVRRPRLPPLFLSYRFSL